MINLRDGYFEMSYPDGYTAILKRKALFSYSCPKCNQIISGLMEMEGREKVKVRKEFRRDSKDPAWIDLKLFFGHKTKYYMPPKYESQLLRTVSGQVGQWFFDVRHFGEFKQPGTDECKYTRVVRPRNACDLAAVLEAVSKGVKVDAGKLQRALDALRLMPSLNSNCWSELGSTKFNMVQDACGSESPIMLLSRWDWQRYDLQRLCEAVDTAAKERRLTGENSVSNS
jgi:hypothetical protein